MNLTYKRLLITFCIYFIFFIFSFIFSLSSSQTISKHEKLVNIVKISAKEIEEGMQLTIIGDAPLKYKYKEISDPPKILLEVPNSQITYPYREILIEKGNINKVTIIPSQKGKTLFEIDLFETYQSDISLSSNQKHIVLKVTNQNKDEEKSEKNIVEAKIESDETNYILAYPEISKITGVISGKKVRLQIEGDNEIIYKVNEVDTPPQIVITIPDFTLNVKSNIIDIGLGSVKNIEANQKSLEPPVSEIKINLTQKTNYDISLSPDKKQITVELDIPKIIPTDEKRIEKISPETKVVKDSLAPKLKSYLSHIIDVDIKKFPEETIISIVGTDPLRYKLIELEKPYKFIVDIHDAILRTAKKEIKVNYGGIKNVKLAQKEKPSRAVKVEMQLSQKLDREIFQTPDMKQIVLIIKSPEKPKVITKEIPIPKKQKIEIPLPPETVDIRPLPPLAPQRLITMDFKDADVRDVIKIFSQMTGVNMIVDTSIGADKKVTVSLKDVPFEQALEMILAPNDLMVHLVGDTYVVVPRKDTKLLGRIGTGVAFGGMSVETFPIKNYTPEQFYNILKQVMPEFDDESKKIDIGIPGTITLIGTRSSLDKVRNFIAQMEPIRGAQVKTFDLKGQKYEDVVKILEKTVPEIKNGIIDVGSRSTLTVIGSKENIAQVERVISALLLAPSYNYQIFELVAVDVEKFKTILKQSYPNVEIISVDIGNKSSSVTLKGTEKDFEEIKKILNELNKKESQAKEVEIIKLQHFETLSKLKEQEGDISALIKAVVPDVKITTDERTNSIIVEGISQDIKRVKELIPKIDVKIPIIRLYVQAIDSKSPISKYFTPGLLISGPYGSGNTSSGEFQINFIKDKAASEVIRATLSTLEAKEEIRYLTNTELHTFSGRKVELEMFDKHSIAVGEEKILDKDGKIIAIIPKYETLDIGIKVTITPRIKFEVEGDKIEEYIILLIDIVIKSPTGEKPRDAKISVNERKMTDVLVRTKPRESIVISGLFTEYERERIIRTPVLSKIPLVGKMFVQRERERTGSEVTIMITPEVNPTK